MALLFMNYGSCKFIWKVWVSPLKKYLSILSFLWFDLSTWMSLLSLLVSVLTLDDTDSLSEMCLTVQRWTLQPSSVMGKAWDHYKGRCHGRGGFRQRSSDHDAAVTEGSSDGRISLMFWDGATCLSRTLWFPLIVLLVEVASTWFACVFLVSCKSCSERSWSMGI